MIAVGLKKANDGEGGHRERERECILTVAVLSFYFVPSISSISSLRGNALIFNLQPPANLIMRQLIAR